MIIFPHRFDNLTEVEDLRARFQKSYPGKYFLDDSASQVNEYLLSLNFLKPGESVSSIEKPGEGNMNMVRRVITNNRSFIIKQARPWVEKYPSITAPVERSVVEATYYRIMEHNEHLTSLSPQLLYADQDNFILIFEDLGKGTDYTFLYHENNYLTDRDKKKLIDYLSELHNLRFSSFPDNRSMRLLNHEHIFHFPYLENNGLKLNEIQPGLEDVSIPIKRDQHLKSKIANLGKQYLDPGPVLIHGDYFPGSWLRTHDGIKVIDPEFSFMGYAEFDLGVFLAHMVMAQQEKGMIEGFLDEYKQPPGFNHELFAGFVGTEILRRLLGVAQLPLFLILEKKEGLIFLASEWIMKETLNFNSYHPEIQFP